MKKLIFGLMVFLLTIQNTYAGWTCLGAVKSVSIAGDGNVMVEIAGSQIHSICNINLQGSFSMLPASCKVAYATILAANLTGKNMAIYYDYENKTGLNCSKIAGWTSMPTYFVTRVD